MRTEPLRSGLFPRTTPADRAALWRIGAYAALLGAGFHWPSFTAIPWAILALLLLIPGVLLSLRR